MPHLDTLEHETGANPRFSVIWLHGLGADAHDFEPLVPELVASDWPPLRFVFPNAPIRPVTVNGGMAMRAWYDISSLDIATQPDVAGIRASIGELAALIAREGERGVPASRVILAGFSQGGAIALATGLRHAAPLAGIVALSTYLPLVDRLDDERSAANQKAPIFIAHGQFDPVVPLALAQRARDTLATLHYAAEWHDYPMAHQVCGAEIDDLRRWLGARFGADG